MVRPHTHTLLDVREQHGLGVDHRSKATSILRLGGWVASAVSSNDLLQAFRRPLPSQPGYATPIPHLWMTGASTWPGGGVSGISGHVIAQTLLG